MNKTLDGDNILQIHTTLQEARCQGYDVTKYKCFGFVRNPWARVRAMYDHQIQYPQWYGGLHPGKFTNFIGKQRNQSEWFTDNAGNMLANFIGRFENLKHDWEALGFDKILRHDNPGYVHDYTKDFTPSERDFVKLVFAEDIERFGYSYGG